MVTSVLLTGPYNIEISTNNKIKTPDGVLIDTKDIPFVRYRFSEYTEENIEFILGNKKKFQCVHLVELNLGTDTMSLLERLTELDDTIAKYVYINISDKEVKDGLSDSVLEQVEKVYDSGLADAINIRDVSDTLFDIALDNIRDQIKTKAGVPKKEIGVCGAPFCFVDENACLTARKARELIAKYSERDDLVPSSNHQIKVCDTDNIGDCVNHCGCIRYHLYTSDMPAPIAKQRDTKKKVKVAVDRADGQENLEVEIEEKPKKAKKVSSKVYRVINW